MLARLESGPVPEPPVQSPDIPAGEHRVGLTVTVSDPGSGDQGSGGQGSGDPRAPRRPWWAPEEQQVAARAIERLVLRSAVRVALVGLATVALATLLWRLRALVLLLLVALFVAVLLDPAVRALSRRGISRAGATVAVYVAGVVVAAALAYVFVHPIVGSATTFARGLPSLVRQAEQGKGQVGRLATRLHLLRFVKTHAPKLESVISGLGRPALSVGRTVVSGVVSAVTIAVVSFFLLLEAPSIASTILSWMRPERAGLARRVADDMARQVTGFMLGNLATSVIAGIVVYVALQITGVPFAGVLAIWVGLVDFLPMIGGLLAGIPAVGVAFLHSVVAGAVTIVVFLVYQQIENHVLYPVIMSRTVRLNPLFILLAVLVGAEVGSVVGSAFGGLCGALLAVPGAGGAQVVARAITEDRRRRAPVGRMPAD